MNDYYEELLVLKEKEIQLYKDFIENKLNCKIREGYMRKERFDNETGMDCYDTYKVIEIPSSVFTLRLD